MPAFSSTSLSKLQTCHPDIQTILHELIKYYDFSVVYGIRTEEEQKKLFAEGRSHIDGVTKKSKHQGEMYNGQLVSLAADIVPYAKGINPFDDNPKNRARYYFMMGMVRAISIRLKEEGKISHDIRFGLDWDSDDIFTDQNFDDLPHMELKG